MAGEKRGQGTGGDNLGTTVSRGRIKKRSVSQKGISCVIWSVKKGFIHIDVPPPFPDKNVIKKRI